MEGKGKEPSFLFTPTTIMSSRRIVIHASFTTSPLHHRLPLELVLVRNALFAWLINRTFSINEQYFFLTTNQPMILLAMTYQPSEQAKNCVGPKQAGKAGR